MKIAKADVYLDKEGELTEDAEAGVELFIAKGQEVTVVHEQKGVKGVEQAEENKLDEPEAENKAAGKKTK